MGLIFYLHLWSSSVLTQKRTARLYVNNKGQTNAYKTMLPIFKIQAVGSMCVHSVWNDLGTFKRKEKLEQTFPLNSFLQPVANTIDDRVASVPPFSSHLSERVLLLCCCHFSVHSNRRRRMWSHEERSWKSIERTLLVLVIAKWLTLTKSSTVITENEY